MCFLVLRSEIVVTSAVAVASQASNNFLKQEGFEMSQRVKNGTRTMRRFFMMSSGKNGANYRHRVKRPKKDNGRIVIISVEHLFIG